jgi:hypothetical protein
VDTHNVPSPATSLTSIIIKFKMPQKIYMRTTGRKFYQNQSNDFRIDIAQIYISLFVSSILKLTVKSMAINYILLSSKISLR